jgi:hypothetical protein
MPLKNDTIDGILLGLFVFYSYGLISGIQKQRKIN